MSHTVPRRRRVHLVPSRADLVDAGFVVVLGMLALVGFRTTFTGQQYLAVAAAGLVLGVVVSSALFSAGHGYQGMIGLVQTFVAGACFATVAVVRKSLWPSIIAHAAIDVFGLVALHFVKPLLEKMLEQEGFHVPH